MNVIKKACQQVPACATPSLARSLAVAHEGAAREGGAAHVSSGIYIPVIPMLIMLTY